MVCKADTGGSNRFGGSQGGSLQNTFFRNCQFDSHRLRVNHLFRQRLVRLGPGRLDHARFGSMWLDINLFYFDGCVLESLFSVRATSLDFGFPLRELKTWFLSGRMKLGRMAFCVTVCCGGGCYSAFFVRIYVVFCVALG